MLQEFFTTEERSKLSKLDNNRIFDFKTVSNFILFGTGIGLDLWVLELSFGPFLMYHDTTITLSSCEFRRFSWSGNASYIPSRCKSDSIINLDKQNYSGFAYGTKGHGSIVFLQTDNWRISFEGGGYFVHEIFDINLKPINYRRLNYYPEFSTRSRTLCENTEFTEGNETRQVDCKTPKGQDMSNDITHGLQITYYFR